MICRDYTKEVGLKPGTPTVPKPVAVVLLIAIAAAGWFGAMKLHELPSPRHAGDDAPAPTATAPAAHATPARR